MPDDIPPTLGTQSSHEQAQSRLTSTPRGSGWRMLDQPVEAEAFLADTWLSVFVDQVNDESRELWVRWPPADAEQADDVHHQVIDASHHRAPDRLFKGMSSGEELPR